MKSFEFGGLLSLFIADSQRVARFERLSSETQERYAMHIVASCLFTRSYAIEAYMQRLMYLGNPRVGILDAHGYNPDSIGWYEFMGIDNWDYVDDGQSIPVKKFVEANDFHFNTLVLLPCNPMREKVESKISALVYSTAINSTWDINNQEQAAQVYLPERGHIKHNAWWRMGSRAVDSVVRGVNNRLPVWRNLPNLG